MLVGDAGTDFTGVVGREIGGDIMFAKLRCCCRSVVICHKSVHVKRKAGPGFVYLHHVMCFG